MLAGMLVVAVPTIFPFALRGPFALIDDVVLFPLGLERHPVDGGQRAARATCS